jgi:protein-tyrosine phosphatase
MDPFKKLTTVDADAHEIVPGIYLGNFRVANSYTLLKAIGITHVLNAAIEHPNYFEHTDIEYKYLPLQDHPNENISQFFADGIKFIHDAIQTRGKVLVHCHAGISRSTTMLTAYLVKKYNKHPNDVLRYIKDIRSIIQPNEGFIDQLRKV